jgi:hypothetical protein
MILDEFVEVRWNGTTRAYYESLGYVYTGHNRTFLAKVSHLPKNCRVKVKVKCDTCGDIKLISWCDYAKRTNKSTCVLCCAAATKTIEYIAMEFYKKGFILLSTAYINAHQKLTYVCTKHPEVLQQAVYNSIQQGYGCYYCGREKTESPHRLTLAKVK